MNRSGTSYQFADIVLDPDAFAVEKSGQVLALEPKSIRLLLYLVQNRSRAVSKEELLRSVWEDVSVSDNSLARLVAQLRKALGDDAKIARYIETVPTIGYRFIAEVVELPARAPLTPAPPVVAPGPAAQRSPWPAAAGLALAVLVILVAVDLWERSRPAAPLYWTGTVLGGPVIASHPRISPDGQLLAFRAIIDGLSQVAVMKPDSSSWTVLTHDRTNGAVAQLAWSHDGSKIYFDREWGPGRIYTIGPLGGEPRLVLENAWLPEPLSDGSIIAQRHSSDGREQLLHFWPDTGRVQMLPASARCVDSPNVRGFPDGHEIAVFGIPSRATGPPQLFILNLETLRTRSLPSVASGTFSEPIAISHDGQSILMQHRRNDTVDTVAIRRSGDGAIQTLISLPGVAAPISQDVGPDGSIYMDHSEFERSVMVVDPTGAVKSEIPIPQPLRGSSGPSVVALTNNAIVFEVKRRGRSDLFIARAGAEPQLLLNSQESAALPGAALGNDKLAFILGNAEQAHLAVASLRGGSVIRRFPADAREVTAVTAPADGQTIYYASDGIIWGQPVAGGDPRRVGQGYDVAADPSGKFLYLIRAGGEGYEVYRMPAAGGEATRIALPEHQFNLTPLNLSSSAVDGAGRILLPVNLLDVFFYRAAVLDPLRRTMTTVPVPPRVIVHGSGWTLDGSIALNITRWSSSLWRYRIASRN